MSDEPKKRKRGDRREESRRRYAKHKEALIQYARDYAEKFPEKKRKSRNESYRRHKESNLRKMAEYRKSHPEAMAEWRLKNKERIRAKWREYYEKNKEVLAIKRRAAFPRNKAAISAARKRYYETPEGRAVCSNIRFKREAKKRGGKCTATRKQLKDFMAGSERCHYCKRTGIKLTIDHFVALANGGDHSIENIVPACCSCNSRKKDRDPHVFIAMLQAETKAKA